MSWFSGIASAGEAAASSAGRGQPWRATDFIELSVQEKATVILSALQLGGTDTSRCRPKKVQRLRRPRTRIGPGGTNIPSLMCWSAEARATPLRRLARLGAARHPHLDGSDHDLDRGRGSRQSQRS